MQNVNKKQEQNRCIISFMAYRWNDAHKRANEKYLKKMSRLTITMTPEQRKKIEEEAAKAELSLTAYIIKKVFG